MPWTGEQFRRKHNHKLTRGQAETAASMANAMIARGVDEGVAIATANKRVKHKAKEAEPPTFGSLAP